MANFKTHMTVAALGSLTATAVCIQKVGLSDEQAVILFFLGLAAGILPDIDLNHSIPSKWFLRFLTFICLFAVVIYTLPRFPYLHVAVYLLLTYILVYLIWTYIFQTITVHRGLFHSIPAAGLWGMGIYFMGVYGLLWSQHFSWLAAAFMAGGYILHLILDECYSVDLLGGRFKQSFGSALTVFSTRKWGSYLILYALLGSSITYAWHPFKFNF